MQNGTGGSIAVVWIRRDDIILVTRCSGKLMIQIIVHQFPACGFVCANFYAIAEYLPKKLVLLSVPF